MMSLIHIAKQNWNNKEIIIIIIISSLFQFCFAIWINYIDIYFITF